MLTYMLVLMLSLDGHHQRLVVQMDMTPETCATALDANRKVAETGQLFCERQP
jgi:hypothetical protein